MSRFIWMTTLIVWGCLPPAAPWPSDLSPLVDADADADVDADADADADVDDTGFGQECWSIFMGEGAESYVSVGPQTVEGGEIYTDNQFTIEMWAWFDWNVADGTFTLASLGDPEAWWLGVEGGLLTFRAGEDQLTADVSNDGWHHVGVVVDRVGRQIRIYIDGERTAVLDEPGAMVQPTELESLRFGRTKGSAFSWPTSIAEVRFGHGALLAGLNPDFSRDRPIDDWIGVWRFQNSLVNSVTGLSAAGDGYEFVQISCP